MDDDLEYEVFPDGTRAVYRIMGAGLFAPKWRNLVRVEEKGTWEDVESSGRSPPSGPEVSGVRSVLAASVRAHPAP